MADDRVNPSDQPLTIDIRTALTSNMENKSPFTMVVPDDYFEHKKRKAITCYNSRPMLGHESMALSLNTDGYSSQTTPAAQLALSHSQIPLYQDPHTYPKNAKTSLFIIMSFIYAKLLVVVCIAYVVSEVVTQGLPLPYYEAFFTYLYGASILFLLYVFCFLLQESSCCQSTEKQPKPPKPKKETKKDKENKKNQKKEKKEKKEKEQKEKEQKDKKDKDKKSGKDKDADKDNKDKEGKEVVAAPPVPPPHPQQQQQRNSRSNIFQHEGYPVKMRDVVRQKSLSETESSPLKSKGGESESQEKLTATSQATPDIETGIIHLGSPVRKRKTTQSTHAHGSFFLRVGAIAFGLGTMIYNGLELGAFFEVPFNSSCYEILRGVNPVLQMIFTFMQMYFIFMNSRLNIHRFKVIARFGLMHIVATNLCVWIRTLVLESLKEITGYLNNNSTGVSTTPGLSTIPGVSPNPTLIQHQPSELENLRSDLSDSAITTTTTAATLLHKVMRTAATIATENYWRPPTLSPSTSTTTQFTTTTPSTTTTMQTTSTTTEFPFLNILMQNAKKNLSQGLGMNSGMFGEAGMDTTGNGEGVLSYDSPLAPAALVDHRALGSNSCERINIMGTIVQDSAPYLYPFIIEYSLIGAAVIYVMWRHIGKYPRYDQGEEDLEQRLEVMLSRRAVAMAQAQHQGRMDCIGASKGLFFGLLLLVASLICLILFFVLIHNPQLSLLAIYLADVSHCVLMAFSVIAIIIGFIRVQGLKFHGDDQSDLNDILLRVSAFGLFVYAVFSTIAGSLNMMTSEPNLLVMITGILSVVQVVLQLLFIADVSRRRVHLPEHDRSKPGRQIVTFLLIANVTMWIIYTFEMHKVLANPVQLDFYGFLAWSMVQRVTLPLCIFHRFHSAVTLAEIWKTSYKPLKLTVSCGTDNSDLNLQSSQETSKLAVWTEI